MLIEIFAYENQITCTYVMYMGLVPTILYSTILLLHLCFKLAN